MWEGQDKGRGGGGGGGGSEGTKRGRAGERRAEAKEEEEEEEEGEEEKKGLTERDPSGKKRVFLFTIICTTNVVQIIVNKNTLFFA